MIRFTTAKPLDVPRLRALVEACYRGDSAKQGWTHEADLLDDERTTEAELAEVLHRPQFATRLPEPLLALEQYDRLVSQSPEPPPCGLVCRDPDDQVFIDLAATRGAGWLVTKDKALLALAKAARRRFGLRILVPAAFSCCQPAR